MQHKMINWNIIIPICLVLVLVTYCSILETKEQIAANTAIEIACIEQRGTYSKLYGCTYPE